VAQTISVLADSFGVSTDTLRYYERRGLLHPSYRTDAGYRVYDDVAAERLRFIKGAQRMGLPLADIKELLDIRDRGQCPCGHTQVVVNRRLAEVETEMAQLAEVRSLLLDLGRRNQECLDPTAQEWACCVTEGR
jgi:DNA-binding transcriptional MerR regulator